jgi:hypothetical protein
MRVICDLVIGTNSVDLGSSRCQPANLASQALLALYLVAIVASLTAVELAAGIPLNPTLAALLGTTLPACLLPIFFVARFSFGYLVSVSFYGMITGFVWLSYFSSSRYDHAVARWSAIASLLAFLIPALFQISPAKRSVVMTPEAMRLLLKLALCAAAVVLVLNVPYGFALVGIHEAERLRNALFRPTLLNYVTNIVINAVLPFAFAFFAQQGRKLLATASLLLIVSFYPLLLNKTVLFAAAWLPLVFLLFRAFEAKQACVISLIAPLLSGLLLYFVGSWEDGSITRYVFGYVNERMFAIPSIAMDYYADFFSANPNTYFCQINLVRAMIGCPYLDQLGVVFANRYQVGNLNASLFATEGIASVAPAWAPVAAFFCGLVLSVGNSFSGHLPASLIATSAGLALPVLLNVPLSTSLLTNGLIVLFLFWYICPNMKDTNLALYHREIGPVA